MVADGSLAMLFGAPGEGKSLLAASLATAVAHGDRLAGLSCAQGRALYVDAENGEHEIHRRVRSLGLPAEHVAVYDVEGFDLRRHRDDLEAVIAHERPSLVVLDSLRSLAPVLDENDPAQTSLALDPMRQLAHRQDVALVIVHHANKAGRDYRGSTAILASVDLAWRLGRAEGDPDRQRRFLECRKSRIGPEPARAWLRLGVELGMVLIGTAEPYDEDEQRAPMPSAQDALAPQVLAALQATGRSRAAVAMALGRDKADGTVRRVFDALAARNGDLE
jgi:predicted ATP-dependent serine protease